MPKNDGQTKTIDLDDVAQIEIATEVRNILESIRPSSMKKKAFQTQVVLRGLKSMKKLPADFGMRGME